ncbi:TetR/AcrR family transcriptional regulator [Gallaecimonas mangrovi]|uniref:TetR/AcrR family transcriptional regulator n=1 Tax=Gallaecimonas mangrovi TaxID=2291597 RepID=UPI000E20AB49|nr:TetR/AcrR family transcriptional regulator [Gallaecimonas mangrovi]
MPYAKGHKAKSRARIIASATELFARHGFEKVSINQIMKEAQMTHGAFYAHFDSKEALYSASFLETLKDNGRSRLVKAPLSVKKLIALAANYWGLRQSGSPQLPGPEAVLFNEIGNDNARIRDLFQSSYEHLRDMLERRIKALNRLHKAQDGPAHIRDKARAILASLVGAVTMARVISDPEEQRRILQAAQQQILALLGVTEDVVGYLGHKSERRS